MNTADTFTFVIASPMLWEGVAISAFHEALRLLSRVLRGTADLAMTGALRNWVTISAEFKVRHYG
ncbi:MAG: hypothetical protein V1792_18905 [Pseudomonadota bacterium]